jgi:hypothetical protein
VALGCSAGTSESFGESEDQLGEARCRSDAPPLVVSPSNSGGTKWTSCSIFVDYNPTIPTDLTIAPGAVVTLRGGSPLRVPPADLRVEGKLIANGVSFRATSTSPFIEMAGSGNELANVSLYGGVQLFFNNSSDNRIENLWVEPSDGWAPLRFEGGQRNVVIGASINVFGSSIFAAGQAEVAIEDSVIVSSRSRGVGVTMVGGAHVDVRRSIVAGFATGIQSKESFLVVDDSAIVRNLEAGIATTGDQGQLPAATCVQQVVTCPNADPGEVTRSMQPPACPVIRHSLVADNGVGINLGSTELLQVSDSSIVNNKGWAIAIDAYALDPETFIRSSEIRGNNKSWPRVPGSLTIPQVFSKHNEGTLPIDRNYWGAPPDAESQYDRFAETQVRLEGSVLAPLPAETRQCQGRENALCSCIDVCLHRSTGSAAARPAVPERPDVGVRTSLLVPSVAAVFGRLVQ